MLKPPNAKILVEKLDRLQQVGGNSSGSSLNERLSVKAFLPTLGVVFILVGVVWFLQGINVLPGSFMTGQTKWAIIGAISFVVGIVLLVGGKLLR